MVSVRQMDWSLNEIKALTVKAARGAGLEWGLAEEAAFAVIWLEMRGRDGVKICAKYLHTIATSGYEKTSCPLLAGAFYMDSGSYSQQLKPSNEFDLLLLPFVSNDNSNGHITRVPGDRLEAIKSLQELAARTYAPSTEESRTKGAGVGDDGND